ncbi:MAG TPA: phage holin family protein [Candidatus Sulfotelmatobacter sp.]|nr:phage holin family protein [Candidatus Sulfotelmatobacter sp.]
MTNHINHERNISEVLTDIKTELKDFVQTRIAMFKAELQEKVKNIKTVAPLAAVAAVLLGTAYLLFTLALVGLAAAFLPDNQYRWFLAFLAVAILWAILGGIAAYFAKREFEIKGLLPKRTIEVLKDDKVWVQAEVKNQI